MQMGEMSIELFVVFLGMTLVVGMTDRLPPQTVLRMIHELYLQAKNMDWSKLKSNENLKLFTESTCRNALACVGVKLCRMLYRMDKSDRRESRDEVILSSIDLIEEIEQHARDQMKYSAYGNGEFNMGWIATQSTYTSKLDPLCAAADALHWYTKAYLAADKYGDDIISGAARIEAAGCILFCGEGDILIPTPVHERAFVRRDFRTEFGEKTKDGHEKLGIRLLDVVDGEHVNVAMKYEMERLSSGKPITVLTSEEKHLIQVSCFQIILLGGQSFHSCGQQFKTFPQPFALNKSLYS